MMAQQHRYPVGSGAGLRALAKSTRSCRTRRGWKSRTMRVGLRFGADSRDRIMLASQELCGFIRRLVVRHAFFSIHDGVTGTHCGRPK